MADARERAVFEYWDGAALVWGDPLQIKGDLFEQLGPAKDDVLTAAARGERAAARAMAAAVRTAFGMQPFDRATGRGATEADCRAAWEALLDFCEQKKSSAAGSPTSSPPTTSTPTPSTTPPS